MKLNAYAFLFAAVILAYAIFFFMAPLVSAEVNRTFYSNVRAHYRLTWSHYFFPVAATIATFLVYLWMRDEVNWPKTTADSVVFLIAALVLLLVSFALGVKSFLYTYVLYGGGSMDLLRIWYYFLFTPFWPAVPGIFAGWLGAYLASSQE